MQVIHRVVGADGPGNQLRALPHEQIPVAIIRHQRNAVAPLAVGRGRVVADELIDHQPGLVGVGLAGFAFGRADRQAAHANVEQFAAGPLLVPFALVVVEQGVVIIRRIAGLPVRAAIKWGQRLARLVGGHVVLVGRVEIGVALEGNPVFFKPLRLEDLIVIRVRLVVERGIAEQQQLHGAGRHPVVELLHQVADGRDILPPRPVFVVHLGGRHHGHAQVVVAATMVGQAQGFPIEGRIRDDNQIDGRAAGSIQRVQILVGHFAKRAGRIEGAAGLQGHVLAQGIGGGHETAGRVEHAGFGPAGVSYVPDQRPGRSTGQHVAVGSLRPNVGKRPEFQLCPAEPELALGVDFEVIEVAIGGGIAAVVGQVHFQLGAGGGQGQLAGNGTHGGNGPKVVVGAGIQGLGS